VKLAPKGYSGCGKTAASKVLLRSRLFHRATRCTRVTRAFLGHIEEGGVADHVPWVALFSRHAPVRVCPL